MAESLVKDHNLSLMVLDRSTNTPLGVMLNGVFHRDEIDTPPSEVKITKTQIICTAIYLFPGDRLLY